MKIWAPFGIVAAFVITFAVLRGWSLWSMVILIMVLGGVAALIANRAAVKRFAARKLAEWRNDARQLALWTQLAFTRRRTHHDTATMTHQMQFLQGRLMSPMNLFAVAAISVVLIPLTFFVQEWRIGRIKEEVRAPCSEIELTRDDEGRFRTDRQSCADLGAQAQAALEWRTRAIEAEAARIRDVARVREEQRLERIAEQQRRAARAALTDRQRRRQDEVVISALGGPSPDLERSMCELARGGPCEGAGGSSPSTTTTPASELPSGS